MELLDKLKENSLAGNKVILSDVHREYTSADVDDISGQVYAYLLERGIGTEDVVMMHCARSALVQICLVGIFKAGACGVIVADWTSEEHFAFFERDCQPKLIITDDVLAEILQTPGRPGYEGPDEHDAAFICYTSSSTGTPKGAVHEYGDLDMVARYSKGVLAGFDLSLVRYLNFHPLYDIGSYQSFLIYLYCNAFVRIPERGLMLDPEKLVGEANQHQINLVSIMPHYFDARLFRKMKYLEMLELSFTVVTGVYDKGLSCCDSYGTSECVIPLTNSFEIDGPYDITPVGKPLEILSLCILDERGQRVGPGEVGEIAFANPYFRGYLNLPGDTAAALRHGLYHTGDIGKFLPDGNLVVLGRKRECICDEQRQVVPMEIEVGLNKLYPGHWFHVGAYHTEKGVRICAFHEPEFKGSLMRVREDLSNLLPAHLLPTDIMEVPSAPRLVSGKLNCAKLEEMFVSSFQRN